MSDSYWKRKQRILDARDYPEVLHQFEGMLCTAFVIKHLIFSRKFLELQSQFQRLNGLNKQLEEQNKELEREIKNLEESIGPGTCIRCVDHPRHQIMVHDNSMCKRERN